MSIHHALPLLLAFSLVAGPASAQEPSAAPSGPPHIVLILADDLGYGDLSCLYGGSLVKTPRVDALAGEGIVFNDAHAASSVSSPSRYGLLTGRYPWRSPLKEGALDGFAPVPIEPDRITLPKALRNAGYDTALIGVWDLALGADGEESSGPLDAGFNSFYGIANSPGAEPLPLLENRRVAEEPTPGEGEWNRGLVGKLTDRAVAWLEKKERAKAPFFLLFAPPAPGPNAEAALALDESVGRILDALDRQALAPRTLVVLTSDNGAPWQYGGTPRNAGWKGGKSDLWEGGHRVPLLVRWPGISPAGQRSNLLVCHTDLLRTLAEIGGYSVREAGAEDSFDVSRAFRDPSVSGPLRDAVLHHGSRGELAVRQGHWKMLMAPGSGGWSYAGRPDSVPLQLHDLSKDPGERSNVYEGNEEAYEHLTIVLEDRRSRSDSRRDAAAWDLPAHLLPPVEPVEPEPDE